MRRRIAKNTRKSSEASARMNLARRGLVVGSDITLALQGAARDELLFLATVGPDA